MLDRAAIAFAKPMLENSARKLAKMGVKAEHLSFTGLAFGAVAATLIATGHSNLALLFVALNRICDGLDGPVARLGTPTDRGAFIDISLDFLFYAMIPLSFAALDPARHGLAAALLLAAFVGTGSSFLAYAIIAAKRGDKSTAYPAKGFYYLGGLTEGTETIACFVAMCLFPNWFPALAAVFAGLCAITISTRLIAGWKAFA